LRLLGDAALRRARRSIAAAPAPAASGGAAAASVPTSLSLSEEYELRQRHVAAQHAEMLRLARQRQNQDRSRMSKAAGTKRTKLVKLHGEQQQQVLAKQQERWGRAAALQERVAQLVRQQYDQLQKLLQEQYKELLQRQKKRRRGSQKAGDGDNDHNLQQQHAQAIEQRHAEHGVQRLELLSERHAQVPAAQQEQQEEQQQQQQQQQQLQLVLRMQSDQLAAHDARLHASLGEYHVKHAAEIAGIEAQQRKAEGANTAGYEARQRRQAQVRARHFPWAHAQLLGVCTDPRDAACAGEGGQRDKSAPVLVPFVA
jgi:hypothetical protein